MPRSSSSSWHVRVRATSHSLRGRLLFFELRLFAPVIPSLLCELLAADSSPGFLAAELAAADEEQQAARGREISSSSRFDGLRVRQALGHGGEFFARASTTRSWSTEIAAQICESFGGLSGFLLGAARQQRLRLSRASCSARGRAVSASLPGVRFRRARPKAADPRAEIRASLRRVDASQPPEIFRLPRAQLSSAATGLARCDFSSKLRQIRLAVLGDGAPAARFRFVLPQARASARAGRLRRAAAGNHAAVIASAVERHEIRADFRWRAVRLPRQSR